MTSPFCIFWLYFDLSLISSSSHIFHENDSILHFKLFMDLIFFGVKILKFVILQFYYYI